jgi:hypothetical protein
MAFRLQDFKKVVRKGRGVAGAALYPHQLKDKRILHRLDLAIRAYDNLVGRPRKEMDAGALEYFLGDHKVARGIVACLGQFYRYETLPLQAIAGPGPLGQLAEEGKRAPADLRAATFAHVNRTRGGFVLESDRETCFREISEPYGLTPMQWERMLHLDAEENQVLVRTGGVPRPDDLMALYNYHSLDTALKRATKIVLEGLRLTAAEAGAVRALAASYGAAVAINAARTAATFTDLAMSSLLPRRAGRLARCVQLLLHSLDTPAEGGYADAQIAGRKCRLNLTPEIIRLLRGGDACRCPVDLRLRLTGIERLHRDLLRLRARGEAAGWRFKRDPDPVVTASGVRLADLHLMRGRKIVAIVLGESEAAPWPCPVVMLPAGKEADAAAVLREAAEALSGAADVTPAEPLPWFMRTAPQDPEPAFAHAA